jgi:hypothetical protein
LNTLCCQPCVAEQVIEDRLFQPQIVEVLIDDGTGILTQLERARPVRLEFARDGGRRKCLMQGRNGAAQVLVTPGQDLPHLYISPRMPATSS